MYFQEGDKATDPVTINSKLLKGRRDFSRFTVQHGIMKNAETLSAILTVDIAWMSGVTRKLAVLPAGDIEHLTKSVADENFEWIV